MTALALIAAALPTAVGHSAPNPSDVARQLDRARDGLRRSDQRAQLLTSELTLLNQRVRGAQARAALTRQRAAAARQAEQASAAQLRGLRRQLNAARTRLAKLRARLLRARKVLAARMVATYKADPPDILSVLLNADGFKQLLETGAFWRRVADQDARIIDAVRVARRDATQQTTRFAALERRQAVVYARRARERRQRDTLAASAQRAQSQLIGSRDTRERRLRSVRVSHRQLADEVDDLQAQQARVQRQLTAAQAKVSAPPAPAPASPPPASSPGSSWRWPVQGPITSPFCEVRSYESCHPGLDIAAPEGTPIRAASSGRVVLVQPTAASGGYGNYTCIQHSTTVSSCYAHQSRFATTNGAQVSGGQVIGYVGNTGNSRGAHLHFEVRVNGAVTNPLSYL